MPTKPTRPTTPDAPRRSSGQGTFAALAEAFVVWLVETFVAYIDAMADFFDATASELATNAALPPATVWQTATAYTTDPIDVVLYNGLLYRCTLDHTSGTFAADLAAGRWTVIPGNYFDTNANTLVVAGGTANALTLTAVNTIQSYATGQRFLIQIATTNTGAVTIDVDGLGAQAIEKYDSGGLPTPIIAGDLQSGEIHEIGYVTDRFILYSLPIRTVTDEIGLQPIVTKTASASSSLDFTEFDSAKYVGYVFKVSDMLMSTTTSSLLVRTSSDGGSTFDSGASDYAWNHSYQQTSTSTAAGNDATSSISLSQDVTNSGAGFSGDVEITSPELAKRTRIGFKGSYQPVVGTFERCDGEGTRLAAAAVDAVRFAPANGTFSGAISMYGIRRPA